MRFHSPACHFQLARNFGVVTTLQEQFYDLLFARTQANWLFLHLIPPFLVVPGIIRGGTAETFPELIASTMPL
jgi:hypothetical protein